MTPNLTQYDAIIINTSGGKDSQAMLTHVVELAKAAGVMDRVIAVHADLGRVEWEGTKELAAAQCAAYGVTMHTVKRSQNDLLDHVEARGMWPSSKARFCTSDHKRGPIHTLFTKVVKEAALGRQMKILNCIGMRAQESPARAKLVELEVDRVASNGKREVTRWLPIHDWTADKVWEVIRASGLPHHKAYDLGMPRLSCAFCVFAPKAALLLAGKHNPELLEAYVAVENKIGHTFRKDFTIASVKAELDAGVEPQKVVDWVM